MSSLAERVVEAHVEWKQSKKEKIRRRVKRWIPKNLEDKIVKSARKYGPRNDEVYICRYNKNEQKIVDEVLKEFNTDEIIFYTGKAKWEFIWGGTLLTNIPGIFAYVKRKKPSLKQSGTMRL